MGVEVLGIKTIGVVGAGTMGNGIAQVAATAGFQVIMADIEKNYIQRGLGAIEKNLQRAIKKGKLYETDAAKIFGRICGTVHLEELGEADVVIEAIIEKMALKQALFQELDSICKGSAVFATNTSGLSITEIASATGRPSQVVGMHFFNPVPVMKLVEIIRGQETSEEAFQAIKELANNFGKVGIEVKEAPLFAVNRILVPMINEAIFVLSEGTASPQDIDKGMVLGANHPIGPLALADLVGLDTLLFVIETLYKETGDSKYRPCPLLKKMVRAGHLGCKSGKGFYTY